jgi:hypothetical protein
VYRRVYLDKIKPVTITGGGPGTLTILNLLPPPGMV